MAEEPPERTRSMDSEREFQFELAFNSDEHDEDLDDFDDIFDAKYSTAASPSPKQFSNQYKISTAKFQKDDIWELASPQLKKTSVKKQFTSPKPQQPVSTYAIHPRPLYSRSQSENSDNGQRKRNSQSEAAVIRDVPPPLEVLSTKEIGTNGLQNSNRTDKECYSYHPPYHTPKSVKKHQQYPSSGHVTSVQNTESTRPSLQNRVPQPSGHAERVHIRNENESPDERSQLTKQTSLYHTRLYTGHDEWDFVRRTTTERRKENRDVKDSLLQAQADWNAVDTIQPGEHFEGKLSSVNKSPLISFNEALAYFQRCNMDSYKYKIKSTVQRSGIDAFNHWMFGPPKMNRHLHEERDLVFAIAQYPFDDNEEVHRRVLQTIYKKLTGTTIDCPRFGSHWEQIGFQGNDPSTDLRACGFLALMTLLYLVMDNNTFHLAREIYKISQHETQNFPFCVMSINMTRIALHILRQEKLSRECNKRQQVIAVVNEFYASIFLHLYTVWKHGQKTIKDSGFVLKDLETSASRNPKILMKKFEDYIGNRKEGAQMASINGSWREFGNQSSGMTFTGIDELERGNAHYV